MLATNLLDVRKIIGSLLGVYGVILLLAGIFGSDADKEKAAGVNVNLWVGLALLIACAVFWGWLSTGRSARSSRSGTVADRAVPAGLDE